MPVVLSVGARILLVLKNLSWITVISGFIGSALALGVIPFFMKQQSIDYNTAIKRATSIPSIIGILGFSTIGYLILKEAKRK